MRDRLDALVAIGDDHPHSARTPPAPAGRAAVAVS